MNVIKMNNMQHSNIMPGMSTFTGNIKQVMNDLMNSILQIRIMEKDELNIYKTL